MPKIKIYIKYFGLMVATFGGYSWRYHTNLAKNFFNVETKLVYHQRVRSTEAD